ncbi:MAG: endonuclease V [Hyphomonadaceae bacterium]
MLAIVDAAYGEDASAAACVTAANWEAAKTIDEITIRSGPPASYEPGQFFRRELPLLLAVLDRLPRRPDIILIDGYVWLDMDGRKGLGAHLYEALDEACAVVGVAKTKFADADEWAAQVVRGAASRPLYVTAAGLSLEEAAAGVKRMHGPHRISTFPGRADRLARRALKA